MELAKTNDRILDVRDVSISFGGIKAVQHLTCSMAEGKITGLIGPNGAGKTTIFNIISGFLKADEGSVFFRDIDITKMPTHKIQKLGLTRTFQDLHLFEGMTVLDNIIMAVPGQNQEHLLYAVFTSGKHEREEAMAKAQKILETVHLWAKKDQMADQLSYAEQKLLVLGRLLASEASFLMLDEPTSGIDPSTIDEIMEIIKVIVHKEKKSVCIIEHNLDVVRKISDRIIFLEHGTMIADGTPEEITSREDLANIYFGKA